MKRLYLPLTHLRSNFCLPLDRSHFPWTTANTSEDVKWLICQDSIAGAAWFQMIDQGPNFLIFCMNMFLHAGLLGWLEQYVHTRMITRHCKHPLWSSCSGAWLRHVCVHGVKWRISAPARQRFCCRCCLILPSPEVASSSPPPPSSHIISHKIA